MKSLGSGCCYYWIPIPRMRSWNCSGWSMRMRNLGLGNYCWNWIPTLTLSWMRTGC